MARLATLALILVLVSFSHSPEARKLLEGTLVLNRLSKGASPRGEGNPITSSASRKLTTLHLAETERFLLAAPSPGIGN
jgi:hypothetical protein|uniref:Uncharacterized protein n=1 Tax=Populus trichocarpa TaxID=3694 RepID=B9N8W4_POPTR